jgi:hypothetical protein
VMILEWQLEKCHGQEGLLTKGRQGMRFYLCPRENIFLLIEYDSHSPKMVINDMIY